MSWRRQGVSLQMQTQPADTKQLFDYVNFVTENIRNAENIYKDFLRWSGLFINDQGDGKKFSIANQLLIYGFDNRSRLVREESEWKSMGVSVTRPDRAINVLKKRGSGYEKRVLYDISATNAEPLKMINGRDWGSKCEALITAAPCKIEFDPFTSNQRTNYIQREEVIKAGRGFQSFENIFASISQEIAHYYISKEMEARHDRKFEELQKKANECSNEKDVYYKIIEGKYYELSPGEPIRKDSNGRLYKLETDENGQLYKVHVEKRQKEVKPAEIRKPVFSYSKAAYQYMAYAVSCCVSVSAGLDPGIYRFSNDKWKEKSLQSIRDDLDIISNAGREILFNYHDRLINQNNAVYMDASENSSVHESEVG